MRPERQAGALAVRGAKRQERSSMDAPRPTPEKRVLPVFRRMLRTSGNALQVFQACPRRGPREAQAHTAESCFHPIQRRQANEQSEHRHSHPDHRACAGHQIPRRASAGPAECHHGGERGPTPSRWRWRSTSATTLCAASPCPAPTALCAARKPWIPAAPSRCPWAMQCLGRIFNLLGDPVDNLARAGGAGALAHPPPAARL